MIRATEINTTVFDPPEPTRRFAEEKDETRNYDCVFFLYAGSPGASKNTSSSKELYDLKTLAPYTANSPVAFFVQGYEETETGKWQTARYSIYGGQVHDETSLILGVRYIYDDKDKSLKGTVEASGRKVSLLDPTSFRNFLASGMNRFPSAKNRVLSISTHGHGFEGFAGEAVVKGRIDDSLFEVPRVETLSVRSVGEEVRRIMKEKGKSFSLLDLNCCLMGQFGPISQLGEVFPYIVASPEIEIQHGDNAHNENVSFQATVPVFKTMISHPRMKPQTIGKKIIEMTGKYSRHKMFDGRTVDDVPTLALYSTKELPGLARALAKLGELLSIGLRDEKTRELVKDAAHSALSYGDPSFKDLKSFVHELDVRGVLNDDKGLKLKEEIARSLDRISPAMFRGKSSDIDYSDAGPLSVFIPILLRISICIII